jgi:hydrogenase maturation protein HypF
MTSANPHGEPVQGNDEAFERLGEIADVLLMHDRDIVVRCDDSVLRVRPDLPTGPGASSGGGIQFLRRARGFTPLAAPETWGPPYLPSAPTSRPACAWSVVGRLSFPSMSAGLTTRRHVQPLMRRPSTFRPSLPCDPRRLAHDAHPDITRPGPHLLWPSV